LRVPGGEPTPALEALCRRLAAGQTPEPPAARKPGPRLTQPAPVTAGPAFQEFPREEPGQRMRFFFHVVGWAFHAAWLLFKRQRRWVRILIAVWLGVILLSKGCTSSHHSTSGLSPEQAQKLKAIADQYQGSQNTADIAKLGAQIGREFSDEAPDKARRSPLLAVPFTAPPGDAAGAKLANSTFAQVYGRISVSHGRMVSLEALPSPTLAATLEQARARHSTYLLWGSVDGEGATQRLTVKILDVADGSVEWSHSYAVAGADPVKIATDVDSNVPSLEDEE
jgi:TolB-like protein